ncbi:hypothetical protein E4U42_005821 [Claviceps africana]|uniref:CAP-Gly domain-containing protein n=1 Tax=Claviceps africana TaxID=83212 RepID=A0A8K0JBN2_9HYPO|nr:hypothetical protein E4U42_005821 [Claviceps africana]
MSEAPPRLGQRVSYAGALCTVRYSGPVAGTTGSWLGVEWDDGSRGKHNGSHGGVRYFTCLSKSPTAASFVRPTRPRDSPQGFLSALREKYLGGDDQSPEARSEPLIRISGTKVAEQVGFDKIWRQLAQVEQLRTVILDGLRVAVAGTEADESIAASCPSIAHLDLSRNLFETIGPVVDICSELSGLRRLSINGNRFGHLLRDESLRRMPDAFAHVTELSLQETLLSWEELCAVAARCPSLVAFHAGSNQLGSLPPVDYAHLPSTLTSLNLEFNDLAALSDLASLTSLTSLCSLHLKGNNMTAVSSSSRDPHGAAAPAAATAAAAGAPVFPPSVRYLDLSYNDVATWSFVDALAVHFAGLTGLRLSHNPVYDAVGVDDQAASSSTPSSSEEESHMVTVGRLANLQSLNFAPIKPADRSNAEMFYLSRIAKQLATVPEAAESTVLAQHPRYAQLCRLYGEPDVVRRNDVNPSFLEARLVTVVFHGPKPEPLTRRIPKSFDVYAVKGIAGALFGLSPLQLQLIWETGEWDPVAGHDDRDGESSGDEEPPSSRPLPGSDDGEDESGRSGRWVKREVVLRDGPKQLGYCVDGPDVRIRVERL